MRVLSSQTDCYFTFAKNVKVAFENSYFIYPNFDIYSSKNCENTSSSDS